MSITNTGLLTALVNELAAVIGARLDAEAGVAAVAAEAGSYWTIDVHVAGPLHGECSISIDAAAATAYAALLSGTPADGTAGAADVTAAAVATALREAVTQAIEVIASQSHFSSVVLTVTGAVARELAGAFTVVGSVALSVAPLKVEMRIVSQGDLTSTPAVAVDEPLDSRFDVLLDIDLPVVIRFGHTDMTIRALTRMSPGSVIDLGRSPDDPVDVLVSDRVVARGEVVIVGGNYGIRILDVVSPSERMRTMEA